MIITVPMVPPSPNELRRKYRHPHAYRRLRKLWEQELFYGASCARHRNALMLEAENYRMQIKVTLFHSKEYDPDNVYASLKPILDALKNIHFIKNDDKYHIKLLEPVQIESKEPKTIVHLTPILMTDKRDLPHHIAG